MKLKLKSNWRIIKNKDAAYRPQKSVPFIFFELWLHIYDIYGGDYSFTTQESAEKFIERAMIRKNRKITIEKTY